MRTLAVLYVAKHSHAILSMNVMFAMADVPTRNILLFDALSHTPGKQKQQDESSHTSNFFHLEIHVS